MNRSGPRQEPWGIPQVTILADDLCPSTVQNCFLFCKYEVIHAPLSLISDPLSLIIHESFLSGVFPEKMQLATVIPFFKKGCPTKKDVSNYRPISLLSVFSKILEKLMYMLLYNFWEVHKILYNLQFGFRTSHSINHALISLTESIKNTLDNKNFGFGIFLDLQKAFDRF